MSVSLDDIIDGAKNLTNLEDLGDGPNDFLTQSQWANLVNGSIEALHKKIVIWNERAVLATQDYDLTATGGDITPPVGYRTFKQLSILDGNGYECRPVHRYTAAQLTNLGDVHYQPQGLSKILLRPQLQAKQKYRLSYTAGPSLLTADDAVASAQTTNATAKAMIGTDFAGYTLVPSGSDTLQIEGHDVVAMNAAGTLSGSWTAAGSGPGKTLTATANGALAPVDGVAVGNASLILVLGFGGGAVGAKDFGLYFVTAPGGVSTPAVLTRFPGLDTSAVYAYGLTAYIGAGTTSGGHEYFLTTPSVTLDTTALAFADIGAPQLVVDNTVCIAGDRIFVNTNGEHPYDGLYDLSFFAASGRFVLTRPGSEKTGTQHPQGYTIAVTLGSVDGNRIYSADSNVFWGVTAATWTTIKSFLDLLYEPSREWLEVRTAIRALGKEESNETANVLNARLTELTGEAMEFYKNLDQGEAPQATRHDTDSHSLAWRIYNGAI